MGLAEAGLADKELASGVVMIEGEAVTEGEAVRVEAASEDEGMTVTGPTDAGAVTLITGLREAREAMFAPLLLLFAPFNDAVTAFVVGIAGQEKEEEEEREIAGRGGGGRGFEGRKGYSKKGEM